MLFACGTLTLVRVFDRAALVLAAFCALVLISSFIAVRFESAAPRLILGLVPALALLVPAPKPLPVYIAVGLMTAFGAAFLASGRFAGESWRYRKEVLWLIPIAAFLGLLSLIEAIAARNTLYFFAAFLFFAVLALRAVRTGTVKSPGWQAESILGWIAVLALAACAAVVLWLGTPVYKLLGEGLKWVFGGFIWLWTRFWGGFMDMVAPPITGVEPMTPDPSFKAEMINEPRPDPINDTDVAFFHAPGEVPWKGILIAIGAILLIVVTVRLIKASRKPEKIRVQDLFFEDDEERVARRKRRRAKKDRTNTDAVREIYRRYLGVLRQRRVYIVKSDTSEQVSIRAEDTVGDDSELRAIYRKARYGRGGITDEELFRAEEIYNRLVSEEKPGEAENTTE